MSGITKNRKRVSAANANKKQKKSKKKVSISAAELQEMVTILMGKTGQSRETIMQSYDTFTKECGAGGGEMSRDQFIKLSKSALGEDAKFLAESIFRVFDNDGSGTMDFQEYVMALNSTSLTSVEDKIKWIFNVFDRDGGGTIDSSEVTEMLKGLFSMAGAEIEEEIVLDCAESIMEALDIDGDGEITKDEFTAHASNNEFLANLLK